MSSSIDAAIHRALSLDPATTRITSHGGSGFASTFRVTTSTTPPKSYFVKVSPGSDGAVMCEGEHASLNAIHAVVPSLCPRSFAWGRMEQRQSSESYFLATEFLQLGRRRRRNQNRTSSASSKPGPGPSGGGGGGMSLAQKLAKLHTTPAPVPDGYGGVPQFGFPVTTCCGDTPQPNTFTSSWSDFFAQNRLLFILQRGESRNGRDPELRRLVVKTASTVVPRLLRAGHLGGGGSEGVMPVVVHGDLWSGNHGIGTFVGRSKTEQSADALEEEEEEEEEEEVIYDPSACYAHSEYELGIMNMFGGFGPAFLDEYHHLVPRTEPVAEYDDRVSLYEVYHHLNHWAIFAGAGYRDGALAILTRLVDRYGRDSG